MIAIKTRQRVYAAACLWCVEGQLGKKLAATLKCTKQFVSISVGGKRGADTGNVKDMSDAYPASATLTNGVKNREWIIRQDAF